MSSDEGELNPYASPKDLKNSGKRIKKKARAAEDDRDSAIQDIVASFQRTRSWISFFATLFYIGTAVAIIGGIAIAALSSNARSGPFAAMGPGIFVVYLILGIVYGLFGSRLFRYRDAINNVIRSEGRLEHIADAVERQSQFWTFAGQVTIAIFAIYVVVFAFGAFVGITRDLPR